MKHPKIAIAALSLSAAGLVTMAVNEGFTDRAIIPTKGDVPTYGFGSTTRPDGSAVQMGDKITPVAALVRKMDYVQKGEARMKQCVRAPLSQQEYDVYVDMFYNIGPGAFCSSTMVKRLNAGDYKGACDAILLFKRVGQQDCSIAGNKICWGLWERRLASHKKCMEAQQ
jgi:lysozyme